MVYLSACRLSTCLLNAAKEAFNRSAYNRCQQVIAVRVADYSGIGEMLQSLSCSCYWIIHTLPVDTNWLKLCYLLVCDNSTTHVVKILRC